ncbi:MAG: tRNA pseudouridine(55) synthase TruB [Clostridia bacterium]|nr:tRNA pseudouridine(55) synthase TruB [Clostridia bacterium]
MDGILIIDKPIGKTSFDIVREVRKEYNTKKVGHIGTLDPLATGVLPILIGKATKLSNFLMEHDKEYKSTVKLGIKTDTSDAEGKIIKDDKLADNYLQSLAKKNNTLPVELSVYIQNILDTFKGESYQTPPMYSAIKINGKKLYDYAREGKTIERTPRKILISKITLLNIDLEQNEITFKVICSKGTYIRTLCEDIAEKLETCGYMKYLQRTMVGNFKIEQSNNFITLEKIFSTNPKIDVKDLEKLKNGMNLPIENTISNSYSGLCNAYYSNKFIGICKINNGYYKRFILIDE